MLEYTDGIKISQYLVFIDERQKNIVLGTCHDTLLTITIRSVLLEPLFYTPWRRWRPWYVRIARRKSRLRKAGQ